MHLRLSSCQRLKPLLDLFTADVARTEDVLHLVWKEQLFELLSDVRGPLRNVEISDDQSEFSKLVYCHFIFS